MMMFSFNAYFFNNTLDTSSLFSVILAFGVYYSNLFKTQNIKYQYYDFALENEN
jgi:hypothetical protein